LEGKDRLGAQRRHLASAHWLRHTSASTAVAVGVPLDVVGALLGHASLTTTSQCVHAQVALRSQGDEEALEATGLIQRRSEMLGTVAAPNGRNGVQKTVQAVSQNSGSGVQNKRCRRSTLGLPEEHWLRVGVNGPAENRASQISRHSPVPKVLH
jgi:hypothetical protein